MIDDAHAKSHALRLTSRYINILAGIDEKVLGSLLAHDENSEKLQFIRKRMLTLFYNFLIADNTVSFSERVAALDAVLSHAEVLPKSWIPSEFWSNPNTIVDHALAMLKLSAGLYPAR